MKPRKTFNKEYYDRFYINPETRAFKKKDLQLLADHVVAYMKYLDIPLRSALDIGCGIGMWRGALKKHRKTIKYTGIDTSDYLCGVYKWKKASIDTFRSETKYDLVICQSVLQYLPVKVLRAGLRNMASLCEGAMYLEIVTKEDWEQNCDQVSTDGSIHLRAVDWYRREISRYFNNCGGGLFIPKDSDVILYELEKV